MQSQAHEGNTESRWKRRPLRIRYGRRHTRGLEAELVNITCSPLHIRSPRVHVPPSILSVLPRTQKRNGPPVPPLQAALVLAYAPNQAAERPSRWAADYGLRERI